MSKHSKEEVKNKPRLEYKVDQNGVVVSVKKVY
jgi:hypothetical protein